MATGKSRRQNTHSSCWSASAILRMQRRLASCSVALSTVAVSSSVIIFWVGGGEGACRVDYTMRHETQHRRRNKRSQSARASVLVCACVCVCLCACVLRLSVAVQLANRGPAEEEEEEEASVVVSALSSSSFRFMTTLRPSENTISSTNWVSTTSDSCCTNASSAALNGISFVAMFYYLSSTHTYTTQQTHRHTDDTLLVLLLLLLLLDLDLDLVRC